MSSGNRIRRLASETAVYGISSVVGRLINFLLFPLYSQVFPPDVYQPVVLIYAAFIFLNILYQHGMESSYLKFATELDERTGRSSAFSTAVVSVTLISLCLSAIVWLLPEPVSRLMELDTRYLPLLMWGGWILLLDALAVVPFADLRLQNRPWMFAGIRLANITVNVGLNILFIFGLGWGIESILLANVAASAASLVLLSPTILSRITAPDSTLWRRMIRFGLPFIPGGLGYAVTERINIFFLARMDPETARSLYHLTPESHPNLYDRAVEQGPIVFTEFVVGTYGGIIKLAVLMALFVQMFRYAWQPFFLQHQKDEDASELFGKVFSILTLVLLTAFLGISFLADELVRLPLPGGRTLISSGYWLGLPIIPIALIGYLFQGWYYHFSAGAYIKDVSKYFLHATLAGSVLALVLNALLVPSYGMWAAAAATSAAYGLMSLTLLLLVRDKYSVPYQWARTGWAVLTAGAFYITWNRVGALQHWWIETILVAVYAVLASRLLGTRLDAVRNSFRRPHTRNK